MISSVRSKRWHFDWLDVPQLVRSADTILEFPMVDQDPLPWWSYGRVTLLGDAAHPMYPRGSNGAGQAILDARALAEALRSHRSPVDALKAYEAERLPFTANVVRMNRTNPPDAILREVFERTGDKPFARVEDVISEQELVALSEGYKRVAGFDRESLGAPAPIPVRTFMTRRPMVRIASLIVVAAVAAAAVAPAPRVQAQEPYPSRPIKLIVPFTPGTGIDILARTLGQKIGDDWKASVVVDNRPGASGNIGTEAVAKAAPDGYMLLTTASTIVLNAASSKRFRTIRSTTSRPSCRLPSANWPW